MRGHVIEVLVPGLREARRTDDSREVVAVQRIVATRDPLTNLLNERACEAVGQSVHSWAVRHHEPMSVVALAVDGRWIHDAMALEIASVLKGLLGDGDVAARTADDEFVVLLADADDERAASFVTELGRGLAPDAFRSTPPVREWCSVGIATVAAGASEEFEPLLERARQYADPTRAQRAAGRGVTARLQQRLALVPLVRGPLEAVRRAHRN